MPADKSTRLRRLFCEPCSKLEPDRAWRAPLGITHCLWCGAYLAGSFTQHAQDCWLYGFNKEISLPDELRDYLKSLALAVPAMMPFPYIEDAEVWMDENASGPISVLILNPGSLKEPSRWTLGWDETSETS